MRAVVVSEQMGPPLDEGIRKFATSLVGGLDAYAESFGVATAPDARAVGGIHVAPGGKLYRSRALRVALDQLAPDLVVYVPSASGTTFSFMRARQLKRMSPKAHVAMVLTQTRKHTPLGKMMLPGLAPDTVFCQSSANGYYLRNLGVEAKFLPSGVDLDVFQPTSPAEKARLREKFRLPASEYLVLHAGHLTQGRNTGVLAKLEGVGRGVMLAGSAGDDSTLKRQLESQGVIVIDKYIDKVEELYQAVDCYVFPTREGDAAMEFPLSVLEAMACDLPVIAHPYGGLPIALQPRNGLLFAETDEDMVAAIAYSKNVRANTREQAAQFAWQNIAAMIIDAAEVKNAGAIVTTI